MYNTGEVTKKALIAALIVIALTCGIILLIMGPGSSEETPPPARAPLGVTIVVTASAA